MSNKASFGLLIGATCIGMACLSGCGGGGTPQAPIGRSAGAREVFTIHWPSAGPSASSRLIPAATQSIRIDVTSEGNVVATQTLNRPSQGDFSTASLTNIPVGTVTNTATAFPQADAAGTPLAIGSDTASITAGQPINVTLNLASTTATILITPEIVYVDKGYSITLTPKGYDGDGHMVLLTPGKITWVSSNPAVATVDSTGKVSGVATGYARITATDTESGRSTFVTVLVSLVFGYIGPWSCTLSHDLSETGGTFAFNVDPQGHVVGWTDLGSEDHVPLTGTVDADGVVDIQSNTESQLLTVHGLINASKLVTGIARVSTPNGPGIGYFTSSYDPGYPLQVYKYSGSFTYAVTGQTVPLSGNLVIATDTVTEAGVSELVGIGYDPVFGDFALAGTYDPVTGVTHLQSAVSSVVTFNFSFDAKNGGGFTVSTDTGNGGGMI